ncbi:ribonuclease Z [Flavihumibacter stibioxidans]|uniref:Ribonuclease Z n=1 Tax=Flavihumibacter stibioxidans TaxID=1834163 RepID=A0ABR7M501_9BACT|nr:ribonuclease Z [Flavihumibacter stibioxidans]MBC6490084.1 ribonuclease Z [Flavihumibacter stibioxidans]
MLAVTILGNNSALPAFDRHPTAQIVTLDEFLFLVDCGEGTQMQMAKYKIRRSRIQHIFISHLHGDHYFGLIGLITSMGLLGRELDLHLFAPEPLKEMIEMQLKVADTALPYQLHFHPLGDDGIIIENEKFRVSSFKVSHRIPCWGFRFEQVKAPRKINPEKAIEHGVPAVFFDRLKWGEDYTTKTGKRILNEWVTDEAPRPKSYAYSADTCYDESIIEHVRGANLLYHETTYLKDLEDRAAKRFHCTTHQAATIAKKAGVGRLLIGHFSSKYEKLNQFEEEAKEVFPDSFLALEGVSYRV